MMNPSEPLRAIRRDGCTYAFVHEHEDWAEILSVFGELDLSVAGELEAAVEEQFRSNLPLVLDLEFCEYLDSTILRVLVHAMHTPKKQMTIVVPPTCKTRRIFEMTRLDEALPVLTDRQEARSWLAPCA